MNFFQGTQINPLFVLIILFWSMFWKILALWRAAKQDQKNWFIVLFLPINTLGILELVYLFKFAKKKLTIEDLKQGNFLTK